MAIPAASGYPQYSGTPLIPPLFSTQYIVDYQCRTLLPQVTTTSWYTSKDANAVVGCGDTVTLMRMPHVSIQSLPKDGKYEPQTVAPSTTTISIDYRDAAAIKFDDYDRKKICTFPALMEGLRSDVMRKFEQRIERQVMSAWYSKIAATNKGATAGGYDMGSYGAPIKLTPLTILDKIAEMDALMDKRCIPNDDRFIILPIEAKPILMASPLSSAFFSGLGKSLYLSCQSMPQIGCMEPFVSNYVCSITDSTTVQAFFIIAGSKSATGFATMMEQAREVADPYSPDFFYQFSQVWGWAVVRPEALVGLYAYFART